MLSKQRGGYPINQMEQVRMVHSREIRRAYVAYQPNLQQPQTPIPLGILAEEFHDGTGTIAIVGRVPTGSVPGLNLDHLWGPFRSSVTDWMRTIDKNIDQVIAEMPEGSFAVDALARQWTKNLYILQPEVVTVKSNRVPLIEYATRWFIRYVGQSPEPKAKRPTRAATSSRQEREVAPWNTRRYDRQELRA
jgi:hypothetical protein